MTTRLKGEELPCAHKRRFTDMKTAIDTSRQLSKRHDTNQTAYHCNFCNQYHLTTRKSDKAKRHKWRKKA